MRPESFRPPLTLAGRFVRLVPLERSHSEALHEASRDPEIGRFMATRPGRTVEEMDSLLSLLLERQAAGTDLPFTVLKEPEGRTVGMTRFLHIDRENDSVEVGGTWFDSTFWRTPLNTESKFVMLRHAFEVEGAHRVYLQTDLRNERSQRAIQRLGAVREGVLREDRHLPNGYFRSSVFYSILVTDWPLIKPRLEQKLARPWTPRL